MKPFCRSSRLLVTKRHTPRWSDEHWHRPREVRVADQRKCAVVKVEPLAINACNHNCVILARKNVLRQHDFRTASDIPESGLPGGLSRIVRINSNY
jgi:hypothetical protein